MSRKLTEPSHPAKPALLRQFIKIARDGVPHQSTRKLAARLRRRADARVSAYVRIARGRET